MDYYWSLQLRRFVRFLCGVLALQTNAEAPAGRFDECLGKPSGFCGECWAALFTDSTDSNAVGSFFWCDELMPLTTSPFALLIQFHPL